jgi:ferredoxin/flavodoxin---NADP+ reductase
VAVIIGHGNVALDIARMLAKTADQLRHTDIAAHALAQLADSRIRDIHIIGRRGPAEARFSVKELREFAALEDCDVVVETQGLPFAASLALHDHPPDARANLALFDELSRRRRSRTRRCAFHFHLEPIAIRGDCRIERVDFARTVDAGTREPIAIDCGLAIQSIGRSTDRLEGVPYDERCGIYANVDGRVGDGGAAIPGLYVCGWSKRGPSGTIGTNRGCSVATVAAILADLDQLRSRAVSAAEALLQRIAARHGGPIDYAGWLRIDAAELARGAADGKPREKLTSIPEMLAIGRRL